MNKAKKSQSRTSRSELKKSDIGHRIAEALSKLGSEFQKPCDQKLKKSDLGDALLQAFMKANSEAARKARKAMSKFAE